MRVYIHSQLRVQNATGFDVHAGWYDTPALEQARRRQSCCIRKPWNLNAVHKYDWLNSNIQGLPVASDRDEPILLADSDVAVQCSAVELRTRLRRLLRDAPLIISAEAKWYPRPEPLNNLQQVSPPFRPAASGMTFPNSGLVAGTRAGFERLDAVIRELPGFPCCRAAQHGHTKNTSFCLQSAGRAAAGKACRKNDRVSCVVEDQACLHAALATGLVPHILDSDASMFLSMYGVVTDQLATTTDGRLAYRPTGTTPCVLHFNGLKALLNVAADWVGAQSSGEWGTVWIPNGDASRRERRQVRHHVDSWITDLSRLPLLGSSMEVREARRHCFRRPSHPRAPRWSCSRFCNPGPVAGRQRLRRCFAPSTACHAPQAQARGHQPDPCFLLLA